MKISAHAKSQWISLTEQISGIGLKVGITIVVAGTGYLLYAMFGPALRQFAEKAAVDRASFERSLELLLTALTVGSAVLVASVILRVFNDEALGQGLSFVGAVLYFGSPWLLSMVGTGVLKGDALRLFAKGVNEFRTMGSISLLPGLVFLLRDAILRIWTGISVRRIEERRWGDEEERRRKHLKSKYYGSCWDMAFCREFVRRVCPAWQAKQPCWRMKVGCYCDEKTILTALTSYGTDNVHVRGIMENLGIDKGRASLLNSRQKRARCRRCGIFAEHQRQKYRILSPAVFPLVGLLFYIFYQRLAGIMWVVLEKTDEFMRALMMRTSEHYSFADQGSVLTTLAMIWLAIIVVSYALRALEYLIFEIQV